MPQCVAIDMEPLERRTPGYFGCHLPGIKLSLSYQLSGTPIGMDRALGVCVCGGWGGRRDVNLFVFHFIFCGGLKIGMVTIQRSEKSVENSGDRINADQLSQSPQFETSREKTTPATRATGNLNGHHHRPPMNTPPPPPTSLIESTSPPITPTEIPTEIPTKVSCSSPKSIFICQKICEPEDSKKYFIL